MDSYKVYFDVKGLETSLFKTIDGLETAMRHEFVRAYNEYVYKCNGGVTDKLNVAFNSLYLNYFRPPVILGAASIASILASHDIYHKRKVAIAAACDRSFKDYRGNDNRNKERYELTDYNQFMADGYQRMVVDEMNNSNFSPLLDFYVDPEEVVFTGRLKVDPNVTISIYLKAH